MRGWEELGGGGYGRKLSLPSRVREVYSHSQRRNWKGMAVSVDTGKGEKNGARSQPWTLKLYIPLDLFHIFHWDVLKIPQTEHFQDQIWSSSFHISEWQDSVQLHEVEIEAQSLIPSSPLQLIIWLVTKTRRSDSLSHSNISPLFSIPLPCAANHHHNPSYRIHTGLRKWANRYPPPNPDTETGFCGQYTLCKMQVPLWLSVLKPLGGFLRLLGWGWESSPGPVDTP